MRSLPKTTMIISFSFGLIPELALSYLGMKFLREGWTTFWIIFLGIQVLHLIKSVCQSAAGWIMFHIKLKSMLAECVYSDLVNYKFPNPRDYPKKYVLNDYFDDVSNNPEINMNTRLMAREISTIVRINVGEGFQKAFQWSKVVDVALQKYAKVNF